MSYIVTRIHPAFSKTFAHFAHVTHIYIWGKTTYNINIVVYHQLYFKYFASNDKTYTTYVN